MSLYDSLGETTFSINDPTISNAPPFKHTRAIAYNGSYWIAAGTIVVRTVGIKTFSAVKQFEETADYYTGLLNSNAINSQRTDAQKLEYKIGYEVERTKNLELATVYFNDYKSNNFIPQAYTWNTVHCFAKSIDGYNWKYVEECPLTFTSIPNTLTVGSDHFSRINGIAWNGSKWMAVGRSRTTVSGTYYLTQTSADPVTGPWPESFYNDVAEIVAVESSDGTTWSVTGTGDNLKVAATPNTQEIDLTIKELNCVTCDTTKWIVGGDTGLWKKGFTEEAWTRIASTIQRTHYRGIATDGTTWVAVGGGDSKTGSFSGGGSVNNAGAIVSSTNDGTTWSKRLNWDLFPVVARQTFKAVAWNGDRWIAVGVKEFRSELPFSYTGIIARSEDGIDWTVTEGFSTGLSCISWDGNEWFAGSTNENILVSKDGFLWSPTTDPTSGVLTIATSIVLPILGGDVNTVKSLIVGVGNPASVLRSYNNIDWTSQILTDSKKQFQNEVRKNLYGVIWSGTHWIIVGERDVYGRTILVSDTGVDWSYPINDLSIGRQVAYGGGLYVAVGDKLVTSSDTEVWVTRASPLKSLHCVAFNGTSLWVAGGDGGIQYSVNGTSWVKSATCPLTTVRGVAWNGYYWVATGSGLQHSVILSKDGIRWYIASEKTIPFSDGFSIAWNRNLWMAVGNGTLPVARSYDGYDWESIATTPLTNGQNVSWTGTHWLASGYGTSAVVSSTNTIVWTEYPVELTRGSGFATNEIVLPLEGSASDSVGLKATTILADLTAKTTATIAEEVLAAALAADEVAKAAALVIRNATKASATDYFTRISFWNTTVTTQVQPFEDTTYVNIEAVRPVEYRNVQSTAIQLQKLVSAATVYKNRIYDDSRLQSDLNFDLDNLVTSVKLCDELMVNFYNAVRVLYSLFAIQTYTSLALSQNLLVLVDSMNFPTATRNMVRTFIIAKQSGLESIKNNIVAVCAVRVFEVSYSNQTTTATNYANLFKTMLAFDLTNRGATYQTDGSNAFFYLTIWNTLYRKFERRIAECNAVVEQAWYDSLRWTTLLGGSSKTLQTVKEEFEPIYAKYFRSVGPDGYPQTTFDTPNMLITLSDTPLRSVKAFAYDYKNPIAYPAGLQSLFTRLKTTTDSVEATRQSAINYMVNKRKTTIKTKLDNIYLVTKTKYVGQLSIDEHIQKITAIMYNKNSNYRFCLDLLKKLKNGYIFAAALRPLLNNIELADIAAEEDGCTPPTGGWGRSSRDYAILTFPLSTGLQTIGITNRGNQYLIGEEIIVPGTHFRGLSPANDITITVKDVGDYDGRLLTWATSGTLPTQSAPYYALGGYGTSNVSAGFNVTPTSSGYTVVAATPLPGLSYVVGQKIVLSGTNFKRKSPANDVMVNISGVDGLGRITDFTSTGNSTISYDDVYGYRNCSCEFTIVQGIPGLPVGQNFIFLINDGGIGYSVGDIVKFEGTRFQGLSPENDITITVASVDSSGSILTFTYGGAYNVLATYDRTFRPLENSSATFTFSNITSGSSYTAAIKNGGSGYRVNERIIILGSSFIGGKSPANDFVVKVNTVSPTGSILTFSIQGSFAFLFEQVSAFGNTIEERALFNVIVNYSPTQTYSVDIHTRGDGYIVNEYIIIPGTSLNGAFPANDLTIVVTEVSEIGAVMAFTWSGVPNTSFAFNTKPIKGITPYKVGRYGRNGWEFYNDTFWKRNELASYIGSNFFGFNGVANTYKLPNIDGTTMMRWRDFLEFINTATYDSIVDSIEALEDKVVLLNSNSELTTTYADALVTADLATIQSKYEEFATTYTQGLLNSVSKIVVSAKFSVAKSGGIYTVSLANAGYGYDVNEDLSFPGTSFGGSAPANTLVLTVKTTGPSGEILTFVKKSGTASAGTETYVVTNNKLAGRFTQIATAQAAIESNYSILYAAPPSISGKTNEQIATIVTSAIAAKNAITSLQSGNNPIQTIITKAIAYLKYYNSAKNQLVDFEDDLIRWTHMKENAYINSPFFEPLLSNGTGDPFIMSILPTNSSYWEPITYTLYKTDPNSDTTYECTLDEETQKVKTTFDAIDITSVDAYSSTQNYFEGMYVKYDNVIYACKKDATQSLFSLNNTRGVKNVDPTGISDCWVQRKYPYVIDVTEEVEFNENMCVPFDSSKFLTYKPTTEYTLGTVVNYENTAYLCSKTVNTDGDISGISPDNLTYWSELEYPLVHTLKGTQFQAKPSAFSAIDPATLNNVLEYSYTFGDFAKTDVTYVDDQGYYRSGISTFQLDQETSSNVSKGYPPVYSYVNGSKYQNYYMWQYVQEGRISDAVYPHSAYSSSSVYKRDDYVVYTGSFIKQDGTTASNVLHTFKLIATYPSAGSSYSSSIISPFYKSTSGFPVATKIQGVAPTETPWSDLGIATLSDATYDFYSPSTQYNLNDIVRYAVSGTVYKYQFIGTMPKYNNVVYIYFGKVSGNKNPWSVRSYPGVYYNNVIVESAPGNIPPLNPASYNAYDDDEDYSQGEYVSYNTKVYICGFAKVGSLYNIPVSNTKYWRPVLYKLITYNGEVIESAPGSVPKLDSDNYDEYDSTITYNVGDMVKVSQLQSSLNINSPQDITTDRQGNIYVLDTGNKVIKKAIVELDEYTVVNIGIANGDARFLTIDGTTSNAKYHSLGSITIDNDTDTIYFTDDGTIRKITANGTVTTIAGYRYLNGILAGYVNAIGGAAKFNHTLGGLCIDTTLNCLYVSDTDNNIIRKVSLVDFAVTTHAGPLTAQEGTFADGTTTAARFNAPSDMDIDVFGNVYVADTNNHCIRKITPAGVVTTLAGQGGSSGYYDSTGTVARFSSPRGIAVNKDGYIFVADTGNNRIRRITPEGVVTTFAGTGVAGSTNGDVATFNSPRGLSVDRYDNVYVSDAGNNQVRKVRPDGRVVSAIRVKTSIHECTSYIQTKTPIVNIPPTNSIYWETRSYPIVYVNGLPYEANPNNTAIFKALNQYDYHRYDNNWMYKFGDLTSYNKQVYQCINTTPVGAQSATITDIPPTNTVHWKEVSNDESLTSSVKSWINGSTYKLGDVVRYLTLLYKCNSAHVGNTDSLPNRPINWALYWKYTPGVTAWTTGTAYEYNHVVSYNNKQYKCLAPHKSSLTETPTRVLPWLVVNQLTASNVIDWDLNVQYLVGTNVIYNGYFYKCEVEHYSAYIDSPYGNKYYWSQITDLSTVGIPATYSSTALYTTNTIVSFRVDNIDSMKHDDDFNTVKFYKCIKTDPNYPSEFTYDTVALIDSKDGDGNYEYGKVPGTWNMHNLPRYGLPDDDPFRIPGFAGALRRRVWMEIEMPYGRVEYLNTLRVLIGRLGITETISSLYSFMPINGEVITPTDYTTDYDFVKNKLETVVNNFIYTVTGTGEDKLTIDNVIANAYKLVTENIKTRKTVPYIINTDFDGIAEGDENKCVDQLMEEINVMKKQYFKSPTVQQRIADDPYSFMSPIALAQTPPQKLFRDLGVGDLAEIQASVNQQSGLSDVTYNPDGTVTFSDTYGVIPSRKYTRADLEYTQNRTNVLENKLELVSISCFEVKQRIGFGIALDMHLSQTKMGGRFLCDSGTFDLPIGEYPILERYANYGDTDKMMYNFFALLNSSLKPPEYTLPLTQETADLALQTFESKNPLVKGLSSFAKGLVGMTVSFFTGQASGVSDLVNGIASLHAAVLTWRGEPVDDATAIVMEASNMNCVKFNQNDDSIHALQTQANYYREQAKQPLFPIEENQLTENEKLTKFIARLNYLLYYVGLFENTIQFELVERVVNIPPPVEVTIGPNQKRTVFQKPIQPENRALRSLKDLKDYKSRILIEKMNLESALARNFGHPPIPPFIGDTVTRKVTEFKKLIDGLPLPTAYPLEGDIKGDTIRLSRQKTTITTETAAIAANTTALEAIETELNQNITVDRRRLLMTNKGRLTDGIRDSNTDIAKAKVQAGIFEQRLAAMDLQKTKWASDHLANNPSKPVTEYIKESDSDFNKRVSQLESERALHEAETARIQEESAQSEHRRKTSIKERLNLNAAELAELERNLSNAELENKAIQLENQRSHAEYRQQLNLAEAEEAVADKNYRRAMAEYQKEVTVAKYKNGIRKREINIAVKDAFDNANEYFEVLNQKKQVTAIKYLAFEEVITAEYHITGTFMQKMLKNAFAIPYEILATALNFATGIGEVPYRVEELLTGRYLYNKLPVAARARIDLISTQLNAIPDKVGARLQAVIQENVADFVTYVNRRRQFTLLLNSNPRLAARGFGTLFAGKTGQRASRLVSKLGVVTKLAASRIGKPTKARFLAGVGFAVEIAGAAVGAWQGGAFSEALTLNV